MTFVTFFEYNSPYFIDPEVKNEETNVEVDICSLPPVNPSPIECSGVIPRYTYNASTETCEKFIYGGCFGTKNLFKNEFACLAQCNKQGTCIISLSNC